MTDDRPAPDVPDTDGVPEIWRLDHPEHGVLEFAVGSPEELRTVDPGYPLRKPPKKGSTPAPEKGSTPAPEKGSTPATVASPGCALLRDGEVVARARQISDRRFSLTADPPKPGEHTTAPPITGPRIQVRTSMLDTAVRQVTFREGRDIVHFDPPPGSAAEARLEAIASTPWKRAVYPVAAGIGRSGWAIAMIVLLPLIGRLLEPVLDWILERIPDIDIPWPEFSLPSIPWPDIPWPDITLPSINLPEISVPGWVEFLIEYSKVWVPLLAGVALAVVAVRQSRRSRETKRRWAAGHPHGHSAEHPVHPEPPEIPAAPSQGGDESSGGGPAGR